MKKKIVITICLLMIFAGCGAPITEENPYGIKDPNEVQSWVNFGVGIGRTSQGVGLATGNPAMIAFGAGLVGLGAWVTNNILKKGKKNGES